MLIVEDQRDLREIYAAYLRAAGFRVETASHGGEAVWAAIDLVPDVVVMDLRLPHLDGWEAIRRLKSDQRTSHIPVIACTGDVLGGAAERALDAGCDAYLVKPVFARDLVREVRKLLPRSRDLRRHA